MNFTHRLCIGDRRPRVVQDFLNLGAEPRIVGVRIGREARRQQDADGFRVRDHYAPAIWASGNFPAMSRVKQTVASWDRVRTATARPVRAPRAGYQPATSWTFHHAAPARSGAEDSRPMPRRPRPCREGQRRRRAFGSVHSFCALASQRGDGLQLPVFFRGDVDRESGQGTWIAHRWPQNSICRPA